MVIRSRMVIQCRTVIRSRTVIQCRMVIRSRMGPRVVEVESIITDKINKLLREAGV